MQLTYTWITYFICTISLNPYDKFEGDPAITIALFFFLNHYSSISEQKQHVRSKELMSWKSGIQCVCLTTVPQRVFWFCYVCWMIKTSNDLLAFCPLGSNHGDGVCSWGGDDGIMSRDCDGGAILGYHGDGIANGLHVSLRYVDLQ